MLVLFLDLPGLVQLLESFSVNSKFSFWTHQSSWLAGALAFLSSILVPCLPEMIKHKMPETYQDIQKVQFPREENDLSSPTWKKLQCCQLYDNFWFRVCNTEIDNISMIVFDLLNKVYSPGQADLQFSHYDNQIREIKGNFKSYKTAILVMFDFWRKIHIWKCKYSNFLFMTLRFYIKSNLTILGGQNLQFWSLLIFQKISHLKVSNIATIPVFWKS